MSKLYYSEEGRVLPSLCEELTRFRRVRKRLLLPATSAAATVHLLARSHPANTSPLHLSVNGQEAAVIEPSKPGSYQWYAVDVDAEVLQEGVNSFELWAESSAMNAWSLGLEAGHTTPGSEVSDDSGATWRSERMGYLNAVLGEYVIRVRLAEGKDPPPPPMTWEDVEGERAQSLRGIIPAAALEGGHTLQRARILSTWLASSWEHTGSNRATQYAPWDAETLLCWGPDQIGHDGKRPVAMCVHYAAAFVSVAQVIGIPARCAVVTGGVNGGNGHFVAEFWDEELSRWVVLDPNSDALFMRDGVPMSMTQIQQAGKDLGELIEWGPASEFQRTFPHMVEFIEDNLEKGVCFPNRSVWFRADLLAHPELSPPGHGSLAYCETGLIWEKRDLDRGFGMFPFFGDQAYFDAAPVAS
jgi:hypothetical protein